MCRHTISSADTQSPGAKPSYRKHYGGSQVDRSCCFKAWEGFFLKRAFRSRHLDPANAFFVPRSKLQERSATLRGLRGTVPEGLAKALELRVSLLFNYLIFLVAGRAGKRSNSIRVWQAESIEAIALKDETPSARAIGDAFPLITLLTMKPYG